MSHPHPRSLRHRKVYVSPPGELLRLSRGQTAEVCRHQQAEPGTPLSLDGEALSRLCAESAVHTRQVPGELGSRLRGGSAKGIRSSQNAGVRHRTKEAAQGGSAVLGTEKPGRSKTPASAPAEVRARAILS